MHNTKNAKIEIRVTSNEKQSMRAAAQQSGYGPRDFSAWVRRVLLGEELHPEYVEVQDKKENSA